MIQSDPHAHGTVQNPTAGRTSVVDVPGSISVEPVELIAEDGALSRGLLYRPVGKTPRVGVHLMHPRTDQSTNYNILPLARAGYTVLGRAGRWPNNDSATTHEHLLLDLAAGIRRLRDVGCDEVVLLGNSGGSSLAAFYQAQASAAAGELLCHTAAGDPFDLNRFDLPLADALVIVGGHIGQGGIMGKLIDPAVIDENDPLATDPAIDLYNPDNGFREPARSSQFDAAFLARYRDGQAARMRRIDARALAWIQRQREAREIVEKLGDAAPVAQIRAAALEPHMIVFRTTAYPAFVDTSIEPDGRPVTSYFSTTPHLENFGASGFGRYITPRAWLSTWSETYSHAQTIPNLAKSDKPLLIVHYSGDCGTRMSEARQMFDTAAAADKTMEVVEGIDHYGLRIAADGSKGERVWTGTNLVIDWLKARFPV
ncbi:MAG: hypothetical protein WCY29_01450 [Novosphingobium sp.]